MVQPIAKIMLGANIMALFGLQVLATFVGNAAGASLGSQLFLADARFALK